MIKKLLAFANYGYIINTELEYKCKINFPTLVVTALQAKKSHDTKCIKINDKTIEIKG